MFDWPPGIQARTKAKIAQILWTLKLDFNGEIKDSQDAVGELLNAMRGHGIDIPDSDVMSYRIILPHLDGGKYGHYIRRVVIGQRTKSIQLASDLPEESHLPDGAGGLSVDEQIDRQLFGGIFEPALGPTSDSSPPPERRGEFTPMSARGHARDDAPVDPDPAPSLAPEPAGDNLPPPDETNVAPARGNTRDQVDMTARGIAREIADQLDGDGDDLDAIISRLDREVAELSGPVVIEEVQAQPREIVDSIVSLMADLESMLATGVGRIAPEGRSEADWNELVQTNAALAERLASVMRRAKAAEARIVEVTNEKNRTIAGLEARLGALTQENIRLSSNIDALMKGERVEGQHLRSAQRFISERPSDRPEGGRNRGGRRRDLPPDIPEGRNPNRTTGSASSLAYSVGPP